MAQQSGGSKAKGFHNVETNTKKTAIQDQEKTEEPPPKETKLDNVGAENTDESKKQKSGSKIPVKSSGKRSNKNANNFATKTKENKLNVSIRDENTLKSSEKVSETGQSSLKTGHSRNKSEPFVFTERQNAEQSFKNREELLENELLEKTKQIESLQKQLKDSPPEDSPTNSAPSEDLERKVKLLSEENYELRERLLKKDAETEKLKTDGTKAQENIVNKILRKENNELHYEKEQLKLERDRLRHVVNEKQDKTEKLVAGLKDTEDKLAQAKRALEERAQASTRLQNRLAQIDTELNAYRARYGELERQTASKRLSEKSKSSRSRSLSPGGKERMESEQDRSQNQITTLHQREAKLLGDRRQLEISVNVLTNKIAELEGKLQKSRSEKRATRERGSQTELEAGNQFTTTMIQGSHQDTVGYSQDSAGQRADDTTRKCRGIVQSLGKFFEELIQNNQDTSAGSSKSRRTTIAARRASELLHELSTSMEHALSTKFQERTPTRVDRSTRTTSPVRRSTAVNTEGSRTLWDKLCDEVAQHEFTFDPLSPPQIEGSSGITDDKQREVQRAERGLQRMYTENGEARCKMKNTESLTKEDATRMMNVSRKETECVVKELLRKHQGEIRTLLENASHSSPIPNVAFDMTNPKISGQDEATMAVQELDCFKSKTAKVQSLVLKLQEIVECAKKDRDSAEGKLQNLAEEMRQKDTLLQAKSLELRRRHGKTLEAEKALHGEINALKNEKATILKENARLHELCRQKDLQLLQKVQEIKAIQQQVGRQNEAHQQNLAKMRKKVEEAWKLYESVKTRAEKKTAEFSEAAEKLKASQGHLLDLWQTLKTVNHVANEHDEL